MNHRMILLCIGIAVSMQMAKSMEPNDKDELNPVLVNARIEYMLGRNEFESDSELKELLSNDVKTIEEKKAIIDKKIESDAPWGFKRAMENHLREKGLKPQLPIATEVSAMPEHADKKTAQRRWSMFYIKDN